MTDVTEARATTDGSIRSTSTDTSDGMGVPVRSARTARRRFSPLMLAVVLLSIVLHLWRLGLRPLAHDEAIDANFAWQARAGAVMRYDPVYHGPLRFYLEGFVLRLFGTTPGWTRLVAALAGIAATFVIACSVRVLGRIGAPAAALVFAISPTVLTVTRTGREDSLVVLVSLALLLVLAQALVEPRARHIVAAGALLATSFALKETTFLFGLAAMCFIVGMLVRAALASNSESRRALTRLTALGRQPWMWSAILFVLVFMFAFTSAFRYADGFRSGLLDGVRYWWSQHDVRRGSQRWFFYSTIYVAYEWLLLGLATVGLYVTLRRRSLVGAWFATMALVQFALYSWAGEKFAWLAVHPLVPAVLIGGMGAQALGERYTGTAQRQLIGATFGLVTVGTVFIGVRPAITDGADPRELLVTVQTSTDVPTIADRLAAGQRNGTIETILVDERDGGSWPWAWYLHSLRGVAYVTADSTALPTGYDAMIVSAAEGPVTVPAGYTIERFALRRWWLPDYDHVGVGDIARWFATRETWNPTASSDQYLLIRTTPAG